MLGRLALVLHHRDGWERNDLDVSRQLSQLGWRQAGEHVVFVAANSA